MPEANIPQAWLSALRRAEAANLIPSIPLAISHDGGFSAAYPYGVNAGQEPICSAVYQCRHEDDIWDAPDGMIGLSVDDGPVSLPGASPRLYDFLQQHDQKITHFMIGANILSSPEMFLRAFEELESQYFVSFRFILPGLYGIGIADGVFWYGQMTLGFIHGRTGTCPP